VTWSLAVVMLSSSGSAAMVFVSAMLSSRSDVASVITDGASGSL